MSADISVNARAAALVERLVADAAELKIGVTRGASGETLIDCGAGYPGGIAAGLRIAEICMGGLGTITIEQTAAVPNWPTTLVGPFVQSGDRLPRKPVCRLAAFAQ